MKIIRFTIVTTLFISILFLPSAFSQDYRQLGLPDGAKMRIGKGIIYGNITFSPDGSLLAVASSIGIWIYDARTGDELNLLITDSRLVPSVAFSPDGKTLASGSYKKFHLWDVATGELKNTLPGHNYEVSSLAFSPDGNTLATGGWSGETVKLWDVSTGKLKKSFIAHTRSVESLAFSLTENLLATGGSDDEDGRVKLWDITTGELKNAFIGSDYRIRNIAFSPDGRTIASCEGWLDRTVRLWNIATGTLKTTLTGHMDGVNTVAFSPDSLTLASGGRDNTVCLWDVSTGNYKSTLISHTDDIVSVAYSPDGTTLASGSMDGTIILWDAENLQKRTTITGHTVGFSSIAFSPDGSTIVSGSEDKMVRLWDTTTGNNRLTFTGHTSPVMSVAFSPDGRTIASSGTSTHEDDWFGVDNTVRIWDVITGTHRAILFGHEKSAYHLTFSPDGRNLVTCGTDKKAIFWDIATGNPLWTIVGDARKEGRVDLNGEGVGRIAFSPDGQMLASGDISEIQLWNVQSRQLIATFPGPISRFSNIAFSPDGNTLASTWQDNEVVYLWNVATGERKTIMTGHTNKFSIITFSPDGKTVVTAGYSEDNNNTVRFWDPVSGELKTTLIGHPNGVRSLTFSPDGTTLATASWDGTILLWDVSSIVNFSRLYADINSDGIENIRDMMAVTTKFGQTGPNEADMNGDGVVNIADLLKVAGLLDNAAVPPTLTYDLQVVPTKTDVEKWLSQAQQLDLTDTTSQKGILFLEKLLSALTPTETALLPNYPNPFNPETWIPYRLANPTDVTIRIYSSDGKLIQSLDLGHQPAGLYQHRTQAAYWNGKNDVGELVASGIYFYSLTAGKYTATRRMVILK